MPEHPTGPGDNVTLRTGRPMPVMGLGTWQLTHDTAGSVRAAIEGGYRMIDTSGDYGTQPGIAEALRASDLTRQNVFLVTKVEEDEDAFAATRDRLGELGVERADLVLIHRPPPSGTGADLFRGLQRARDQGLTVDIGVSNYSLAQIDALTDATGERPTVNQIEWSPFGWSETMRDGCRSRGIVVQAYSPLTRGRRLDALVLAEIGDRYRKSPAQVLVRWSLQVGCVPLPKANDRRHQTENLDVFDFELDEEDMRRLAACNEQYSALGSSLQYL